MPSAKNNRTKRISNKPANRKRRLNTEIKRCEKKLNKLLGLYESIRTRALDAGPQEQQGSAQAERHSGHCAGQQASQGSAQPHRQDESASQRTRMR